MLIMAIMDSAKTILEWVDDYGADKVFMVLFFIMYMRSQKKLGILQDKRLEDSKEALQALIEAKYVFGTLAECQKRLSDNFVEYSRELNHKLDTIIGSCSNKGGPHE